MATRKHNDTFTGGLAKLTTGAFSGSTRTSISGFKPSAGLTFGKPSSSQALNPTSSSSGFNLGNLGKELSSGNGLAGMLSSGLASFGGIGSLVSGISHLFGGGQKTLPALQLFQLPDAVNQTVHVNSANGGAASPSINVHVQALDSQSFIARSNDIAKAVKSAMLNSHSLNDVVAEI
ncbi:MAG TPA: hypothetical protein VN633_13015 [Bryobacteraceae bacterium]|nr:hypothetical protein [Bryobacteraceae bacterium]